MLFQDNHFNFIPCSSYHHGYDYAHVSLDFISGRCKALIPFSSRLKQHISSWKCPTRINQSPPLRIMPIIPSRIFYSRRKIFLEMETRWNEGFIVPGSLSLDVFGKRQLWGGAGPNCQAQCFIGNRGPGLSGQWKIWQRSPIWPLKWSLFIRAVLSILSANLKPPVNKHFHFMSWQSTLLKNEPLPRSLHWFLLKTVTRWVNFVVRSTDERKLRNSLHR